ncbi:hypothetical protein [Branchiibius sp. NY16-3462-2]|uniref:hypothetical protein n=1 Tax=Branchiibius sp. NY16-3462-2 TaxID=1807500 RepID=UPI00079BCBD0|nr:hypothetical protein [Branchiibius sp. NY16-3462-2]KYH44934.1 hypothetical protein AZH51_13595 [Branchiibius sp. NY16-3462-2]
MSDVRLRPIAQLDTSGARAVAHRVVDDQHLLVVPQLAIDVPDLPPDMNGGDSDEATTLLLHWDAVAEVARTAQELPVPGGEDAELFTVGSRTFLAVASLRAGREPGDYEWTVPQTVFEWDGERFTPFWSVPGLAGKQWRHFQIGEQHFLALAQGVSPSLVPGDAERSSCIFRWDGAGFVPLQDVDSEWGYNWAHFHVGGHDFLAYADHLRPSVLLRWSGDRFVDHQELLPAGGQGRAFAHLTRDGEDYLLVASLQESSAVLRWDGSKFVAHQRLSGPAAREWEVVEADGRLFVVRINFIEGTPRQPHTALTSLLYEWIDDQLVEVATFPTHGGTDVTSWRDEGGALVAVSNSLAADVRFRTPSIVYRLELG